MTAKELRYIDEAIASILKAPYYNSDMTDIDNFHNDLRGFIAGKIKIMPEPEPEIIEFPAVLVPTKDDTPTAKHPNQYAKSHKKKVAEDEPCLSDEAIVSDVETDVTC
jgi:hypothetical protein